jgi:hypothetical protein
MPLQCASTTPPDLFSDSLFPSMLSKDQMTLQGMAQESAFIKRSKGFFCPLTIPGANGKI